MNRTRILASGKFDLLHPGHLYYLRESSNLVDNSELWVVIAHETNIPNRVFSNQERERTLESFKFVDKVLIGSKEKDFKGILEKVKPDIIALGHDQAEKKIKESVQQIGLDAEIERIGALKPEKYSSSRIKEEAKKS